MTTIIELKNITFRYPGTADSALKNISFSVDRGEKVAIIGSNGAGKSTLLLMLNGMLRPDVGEIVFDGKQIAYDKHSLRDLRRRVGFVFQNPDHQIIAPTVFQDVAFGPLNLGYKNETLHRAVRQALQYVGMSDFERRPSHRLSGGEKKKVAMAGILAMDPDVLVFDEPTSALDPASSQGIMELLDEMRESGKTVIISTHDVELAYPWADTIVLMDQGAVLEINSPEKIFSNKEQIKRSSLSVPVILDLYQSFVERGLAPPGNCPRSVLDFVDLIATDRVQGTGAHDYGTIHVFDSERVPGETILEFIRLRGIDAVGAMGTKPKLFAGSNAIGLDFTYGVIDKSILKAINGADVAIITNPGMIERVVYRVHAFNTESGREIRIERHS